MKKIDFVSEQEVKNLVANGDFYGYHYGIDIPMQFYTKDTESGKYILHSDTAEFQDFIEKVKEEVFHQCFEGNVFEETNLEDIICDFKLGTSGLGKLFFSTYDDYLGNILKCEKIVRTFKIILPQSLKNKGENDKEFQEFIKRTTKTIGYVYRVDTDTATIDWKLSENKYGEKVIELTIEFTIGEE